MYIKEKTTKSGIKRYEFFEKYIDPLTNKWREVSVTMNKNTRTFQNEARKQLQRKIEDKLKDRTTKELKSLTLHEAMNEWLEQIKKYSNLKQTTIKAYSYEIEDMKKSIESSILIKQIPFPYLQLLIDEWSKELKYSRVKSHKNRLSAVYKYVRDQYDLEDITAIERVKLPSNTLSRDEVLMRKNNYLTDIERLELMGALQRLYKENENYDRGLTYYSAWKALELQLDTGMRIGEVIALQFKDINKFNNTIDINGTMVDANDETSGRYGYKDKTKTEKSTRSIMILDSSMQIFNEFKKLAYSHQFRYDFVDRDFIFVNTRGNPISINQINKILNDAVRMTSIKKRITTHTMRHTHISILSQTGISLKAIQERVGHSDPNTTLSIYTHVTDKMENDLMFKLEQYDKKLLESQKESLKVIKL
ncbi:site-specific integrase [Staphylococcus equorum]|uniref:tyrosine-type recombinase/integrase n=1 Tax=Staphylococcus equorum TaxID=246432 RepID=UPI003B00A3E9